jgi:hypothetical protein
MIGVSVRELEQAREEIEPRPGDEWVEVRSVTLDVIQGLIEEADEDVVAAARASAARLAQYDGADWPF